MAKIWLIIILIVAIVAGVYLATNRTSFFGRADESNVPEAIVISNIDTDSLTITYYTAQTEKTLVNYGQGSGTSSSAIDDRGGADNRKTHSATLKNLKPDTQYSIKVSDQVYQVQTSASAGSQNSKAYQGNVTLPDKSPVEEGIVYFKLSDGQLLSSPIGSNGSFNFNLSDYRTSNLASGYDFVPASQAEFFVQAGDDGVGYYNTLAGANQSIDILIERTFIPFFKIQQGPLIGN